MKAKVTAKNPNALFVYWEGHGIQGEAQEDEATEVLVRKEPQNQMSSHELLLRETAT